MLDASPCLDPASARSVAELESIASRFAKSIGCDNFSYLVTRLPQGRRSSDNIIISSYAGEWIAHYLARTYQYYDPVAKIARTARMPYFWGHRGFLRAFEKAERYVFHEAAEFGILEGYSVPISGPELDSAVFSVVVGSRNELPDIVHGQIGALQIFAAKFHDAAVRLDETEHAPGDIDLTNRERQVLAWTAEGYSSEAVAARLGLSASAVNYHIANCCRKLGASNKIQAVALAIRGNLL